MGEESISEGDRMQEPEPFQPVIKRIDIANACSWPLEFQSCAIGCVGAWLTHPAEDCAPKAALRTRSRDWRRWRS